MSDPNKFPFDSIPLNTGGASVAEAPRPSFSRSVPDASAAGLLPPTRKPVAVTLPDPLPTMDPPAADPNPMASTPPPKAGSVRSFLWDLVRPTRTKWAILAGGASLVAGAYGLNLFVPSPGETAKTTLPTASTAKAGPTPQILDERQRPPSIDESRTATAVPPPKEFAPAPLPPFTATPTNPIIAARADVPVPPPMPLKPDVPAPVSAPPLPVPMTPVEDSLKGTALPALPPVNMQPELPKGSALPPVNFTEPAAVPTPPPKPVESAPLPLPAMPVMTEKPADTLPKPAPAFVEATDPSKKVETAPPFAGSPNKVEPTPITEVKLPPVDTKLPPPVVDPKPLPPVVPDPKAIPVTSTLPPVGGALPPPSMVDIKPVEPAPPKPVGVEPVAAPPAPAVKFTPVVKEEPPAAFTVVGVKDTPVAPPVGGPPPKKGFEVDVVKVRASDTYTSISEAFYQSRKYAAPLRAFNGDVDIGRLQEVEVPPLYELQKQAGTPPREADPTGGGRGVIPVRGTTPVDPPVRGPVIDPAGDAGESADWGPAGKRRAVIKYDRFTTPKEGMTARDVARAVYDDETQWAKLIGPRGAKLRADDPLPRGTELTVPKEELPWK